MQTWFVEVISTSIWENPLVSSQKYMQTGRLAARWIQVGKKHKKQPEISRLESGGTKNIPKFVKEIPSLKLIYK